jgi:hypothetical protein
MGALPPGPADQSQGTIRVDEGTLSRSETPRPQPADVSGSSRRLATAETATVIVVPIESAPQGESLGAFIARTVRAIEHDAALTRRSTGGQAAKLLASAIVGNAVAKPVGSLTPLQWALRGFGALPVEFTKSGAIQVFEFTGSQRLVRVAIPAAAKAALVFLAFNGGVYAGALINQMLSEETKTAIGGTINEIVNEGGWKDLWRNPFGWKFWLR